MLEALFMGLVWLVQQSLPWLPAGLWCAWWLWGVDWKQAWGVLSRGGWVGVLLLTFLSALAWSQVFPSSLHPLGFPIANFWWQLGACGLLVLAALLCGFIQEKLHWAPAEVSFHPPEGHADHESHHH